MALRTIRVQGDPVLEKVCKPVKEMTPKIGELIEDMLDTMYEANGVGLAAPQVGILKRIVVIDVGEGPIVMINPVILETSGEQTGDEGCLSIPGKAGQVTRPNYVKARAYDENMEEYEIEGTELLARAICHETDHLDGHLYVEKVTEIDNIDDQIKFELLTIIENNFVINKCENCGKLFIPITSSNNKNQKARTDQKYCDSIYLDTGKTCKEIGAMNKRKEKVKNNPILKEFNKEYKRMYGLHYNHPKKFKETKFNEWSKKAQKLRDRYINEQIEDFRIELKKLSDKYYIA